MALSTGLETGKLTTMNLGDAAPDLTFTTTDGRPVPLSSLRGEATALIFLRHLG